MARMERGRACRRLGVVTTALAMVLAIGVAMPPTVRAESEEGPVRLADDFDRADGPLGHAATGHGWSTLHGSAVVRDGRAGVDAGGYTLAVVDSGGADGRVEVTVAVPAAELWLVLRASDGANYWRFGRWGNGPYQLQQVTGGALGSPPISTLGIVPVQAGDRLACRLDGPSIVCGVNGTDVVGVTDGFNQAARSVGFATYDGAPSPVRFDDLRVTDAAAPPEEDDPAEPGPLPEGARVVDRFDRSDGPVLGTAETGQRWFAWHGSLGVRDGRLGAYGGGYSLAVLDGGGADGVVSARVDTLGPELWLVFRASDGANYWRFGRWGGGGYLLQQVVGGNLGSPPVQQLATVAPGAGDTVSCRMEAASVTCSVNGTAVVAVHDTFNSAARLVGFATYGADTPPVQFDELVVAELPATDGSSTDPGPAPDPSAPPVRLPPAPRAVVADGFDRPDAPVLGAADTGEPWTSLTGTFGADAGAARAGSDGGAVAVHTGFADGTFDVRIEEAQGAFWALFRVRDAENHFRVGPDPLTGRYRVEKVVDGQVRSTQHHVVREGIAAADGDLLRVVTRPDDGFFVSVNGVHVIDGGDPDLLSETGFGLAASSAGPRFASAEVRHLMTASSVVTDGFDRPTGSELGAPDTGVSYRWYNAQSWPWVVEDGTAHHPGGHVGLVRLDTTSELADVQVTVTRIADDYGVVFRYDESGSYYRFGRSGAGAEYRVQLVGAPGAAPPVLHSVAPADGDVLEVRQGLDGTIRCLVNGVTTHEWTDVSTNVRGTNYGLTTWGSHARFDRFEVVPK